ncbi:MAG: hypothetical protein ACXWM8_03785 [Candidatus Limnocylindrales bacterium]
MGLLDDAIREHLDLKRRRGADPSEVERAEREALGPVRREPKEAGLDEAPLDDVGEGAEEVDEGVEEELPYADAETEWDDTWERGHEPEAPGARAVPPVAAPPPVGAPSRRGEEPPPPPEDQERRASEEPFDHGEETAEYDVPGAIEREKREEADDVLEETPEFLQDTPDHDRLWFEQKPPRDFDFDG